MDERDIPLKLSSLYQMGKLRLWKKKSTVQLGFCFKWENWFFSIFKFCCL